MSSESKGVVIKCWYFADPTKFFLRQTGQCDELWRINPSGDPKLASSVDSKLGSPVGERREEDLFWDVSDDELLPPEHLLLNSVIAHGLASSTPTPWTRFLKQGLYDPRLFAFFIRPFLGE